MNTLVLDWLNENELRSYPVRDSSLRTDGSFVLADDVIVDAQFVFDTIPTNFRLTNITKGVSTTVFTFSNSLQITTPNTPSRTRHTAGHLLVLGPGIVDITAGSYNLNVYFEPSVVHEFGGAWKGVTSLSFSSAKTGTFNFIEGYQFDIDIVKQNIALAIGNLYGTPISCTHFSSHPQDCGSIISFISFTQPDGNANLFIKNGPGIVVWDDPDNHRIYVGFSFTSAKDICPDIPPFPI